MKKLDTQIKALTNEAGDIAYFIYQGRWHVASFANDEQIDEALRELMNKV